MDKVLGVTTLRLLARRFSQVLGLDLCRAGAGQGLKEPPLMA